MSSAMFKVEADSFVIKFFKSKKGHPINTVLLDRAAVKKMIMVAYQQGYDDTKKMYENPYVKVTGVTEDDF